MGYFGRIEKCARYYDSSAGEYKWGAWKYTGSSAAGVDYVSNDGLSVVYRVPVSYAAADTGLQSFAIWTNYVTPTSYGNPTTAYCYLYTADPTGGGNAEIATAPLGYDAFAGPVNFDASIVGNYTGFSFAPLAAKPAMLYFWFTSSIEYTSYGSNQIYHYATGNYDKLLNTGTRTPAITGGFPDSGAGGGDGGGGADGSYSVIASGSYSGIGYETTFDYSRREKSASYTALSFVSACTVQISAARSGEYDSGLFMDGYVTRSTAFNSANGKPTGTIVASSEGGGAYNLTFEAAANTTYYLWSVIHRSGYIDTTVAISIKPTGAQFSIKDCGAHTGLSQQSVSYSMSVGAYQVGRMKLSFNYSTVVEITVSSTGDDQISRLYISTQPDIDKYTGSPLDYDTYLTPGSSNTTLSKGVTYYFFAICGGGLSSGTVSFTVKPPPVVWTEGDRAEYLLIENPVSRSVSLAASKYSVIKLSFAHSGTAQFYTDNSTINDYDMLRGFLCEADDMDSNSGWPIEDLARAEGSDQPGQSKDYSFSFDVVAGKTYYLFTKNAYTGGPQSTACKTTVHIVPPAAPSGGYTLVESAQSLDLGVDCSFPVTLQSYTVSRREISFAYSGEAGFKVAVTAPSVAEPHLRVYISSGAGIDLASGTPTGSILLSNTSGGSAAELKYIVASRARLYLFIIADEVYMETQSPLTLTVTVPPTAYFKITQRAAIYGIAEHTSFEAAPGEAGVCLLELSFEKSGLVQFSTSDAAGGLTFLRGYLGYLPALNSATGEPSAEIIKASPPSDTSKPDYNFAAYVEAGTAYYLFSRDDWVYSTPGFIINITPLPGAMHIMLGGAAKAARAFVYTQGAWRAALPKCYVSGAWHTGG